MFTVTRIETIKTAHDARSEKVPPIPKMASVKMVQGFFVDRNLIKLTGNLHAGILLSRLVQIHEESGVLHDGQRWIARTKAEWFEDLGLTTGMFDRALQKLRDRNLVFTSKSNIDGRVMVLVRRNESILEAELKRLCSLGKGR